MASFIMAMSINPTAKKHHGDLSVKISESLECFDANGAKVQNIYATMGRYDILAVFQAADQTVAFKVASDITRQGILDTETWPVIPFEDFSQMIG
ncbi:MAG: GYD domain-containing protein [Candidatus Zixiibacteriota bacterium]|nr:MAG: GYD domain-containing protein [candidate division Zixibacteria bacterium]